MKALGAFIGVCGQLDIYAHVRVCVCRGIVPYFFLDQPKLNLSLWND